MSSRKDSGRLKLWPWKYWINLTVVMKPLNARLIKVMLRIEIGTSRYMQLSHLSLIMKDCYPGTLIFLLINTVNSS